MAKHTTNAALKLSIEKWKDNTTEQIAALARQSIQEMAKRIVEATPVDTGFLRSSWQPSIGAIEEAANVGADPGGSAAAAKVAAVIAGLKVGDTFFMSNNAAYALRMEFGFVGQDKLGRNYNQEGRYFVTNTVEQWPAIVAEVAKSLGLTESGGSPRNPNQYDIP